MFNNDKDSDICEGCSCFNAETVKSVRRNLITDEIIYDVADFFKVFGDSTRIKILYALLEEEEMCVGDLVQSLDMTQSAVSHQLRILRQNDLVSFRKEGKAVFYKLDDEHVSALLQQSLCHLIHKKNYDFEKIKRGVENE